ncbi:MAG: ATP-dependent sacrificial sulfur transferase LarE [Eubacteriales bacterium]|nr:ATP-dependent sacrificial sulfur transferase LarE [Eubacteriales bacterium]
MQNKLLLLKQKIAAYGTLAVAFSGGVDSAFLLSYAKEVLGEGVIAVTAMAPNFDPKEISGAKKFCEEKDIRHLIINLGPELIAKFCHNPEDRCYICKKEVFSKLRSTVNDLGYYNLADGTNRDDMDDFRPGQKALTELKIASPLKEAGFTKADIRQGLKAMNIDMWDKPAFACLASRIPYGEEITVKKLNSVNDAESALMDLGFRQVRVRHHGDVARIEVLPEERNLFYNEKFMDHVNAAVKKAGFKYASLDLSGYKMGNLNKETDKDKEYKKHGKSKK